MTLPEGCHDEANGYGDRDTVKGSDPNQRRPPSIVTPRDVMRPSPRNRSVMSDLTPETRLSFLPIIRRSSMASSVASSLKSGSLYSSSTGSSSPMSGPSTGFSSPAKMAHLPRVLLREMQPGLFDVQDELVFNRAMRLPLLDTSPTDCRLNLVAQKLQEGTADTQETSAPAKLPESDREMRQTRDSERENQTKRKRRKNRKRSEYRRKEPEVD